MHRRQVALLNKEITELGCQEEKWQLLHDLLNDPLSKLQDGSPPPAVIFDDSGSPVPENGVQNKVTVCHSEVKV